MFSLLGGFNRMWRSESAPAVMNRDDKRLVCLEEGRLKRRKCHIMYNRGCRQETIHYEFDVSDEDTVTNGDDGGDAVEEKDYEKPTYKSLNIELLLFINSDNPDKTRADCVTCSVHQRRRMDKDELTDPYEEAAIWSWWMKPSSTEFVIDVKSSILFSSYPENWWKPWRLDLFFRRLFEISGIDQDVGARVFYTLGKYTEIVGDKTDQPTIERAVRVYSDFCKRLGVS